jgi:hypothetical protein
LLKTIDVLDALRSQHALDISAEERAKMKLVQDVNRWRGVAKSLEVEKDELKDVVEDLIEKGMSTTLFLPQVTPQHSILWHGLHAVFLPIYLVYQFKSRTNGAHGRVVGCRSLNMQVCRLVRSPNPSNAFQRGNLNIEFPEQIAVGAMDGGGTKDNNDLLAYATSIIARLRMELDFERQSHRRTVEEANLCIEELEAKVAVRDAELENRITSPGDYEHQPGEPQNVSTHAFEKRKLGHRLPEPKPLSDEECLRFLESNGARNRSLEIEIRHIAERVCILP